jgi:hypothetical protein
MRFGEGLPLGLKDSYAAITLYGEILDDVTSKEWEWKSAFSIPSSDLLITA